MFEIGGDVQIHPTAQINVKHGFIGDRSIIKAGVIIEGYHVEIGQEAWINRYVDIGGGGCFDPQAKLVAGDFFHVGLHSHINFGYAVTIGHEFGGIGVNILTHGVYPSAWEGFPAQFAGVTIGDHVWMPNTWVNPGVTVGSNVVVAAGSLINRDIPSGCLVGGIPAKAIRENAYPRKLSSEEKRRLFIRIFEQAERIDSNLHHYVRLGEGVFRVDWNTVFNIDERKMDGHVTAFTDTLKNQLRRNGIRFRYGDKGGVYVPWELL